MNVKQWLIIGAGVCCLPLVIVIGALMAVFGSDPFAALKRLTHEG